MHPPKPQLKKFGASPFVVLFSRGEQGLAPCGVANLGSLAGTCTLRQSDFDTAICDPTLHFVYLSVNIRFIGVEADVDRLSLYLAPHKGVFHQDADLSGFFIA